MWALFKTYIYAFYSRYLRYATFLKRYIPLLLRDVIKRVQTEMNWLRNKNKGSKNSL